MNCRIFSCDGPRCTGALARLDGLTDGVIDALRQYPPSVAAVDCRAPVLRPDDVTAGALVVALGADGPGKQELDPRNLAALAEHKLIHPGSVGGSG